MARKKNNEKKRREDENSRNDSWHLALQPETKKSIAAVCFFILTALSLLSYWGRAGVLGSYIFNTFDVLFGKGYFFVPIVLLLLAFAFLFSLHTDDDEEKKGVQAYIGARVVGGLLMLLTSLGMLDVVFQNKTAGFIGFAVSFPFLRLFDFWATLVILAGIFVISILILFNVPIWHPRFDEEEEEEREEEPLAKAAYGMTAAAETFKAAAGKIAEGYPKALPLEKSETKSAPKADAEKSEEELKISKTLDKKLKNIAYVRPPFDLLQSDKGAPSAGDIRANANIIQRTLQSFGIHVEMGEVSIGPTVTQYTLKPAEGVKVSRITALHSNLALALAAHPIRIEAPIPGRSVVGIEVPNRSIALVGLRALLEDEGFQSGKTLSFALGRDVTGAPVYADLAKMPHLLVAGATGSGKSVTIHALITSLLYRNPAEILRMIMIDPKRVELSLYNGIPHLLTPVITDPKKAIAALRWATKEMENRYELLSEAGVRDIASYNVEKTKKPEGKVMPYIVIMVDELADLMLSYPREVEASVVRLAQMARAVGIHLVISTQRPSVEVITGLIKANITSRIALQVASQIDSRTILDMPGADKLLGNGDMLFLAGDTGKPKRIQGAYVSESEVKKIAKFIADQNDIVVEGASEDITALPKVDEFIAEGDDDDADDPLYEDAKAAVLEAGKASTSYLQRKLRVGYARAARLIDILEEKGVVGPGDGAKPREILIERGAEYAEGSEEANFMKEHEKDLPEEI